MKKPLFPALSARAVRAAAWLTLSMTLLGPAHANPAPQVYPPLAAPIAEPMNDAFYVSPSPNDLGVMSPGTVFRQREISAKAYYLFPVKGQAWQLMYRSTDHEGRADGRGAREGARAGPDHARAPGYGRAAGRRGDEPSRHGACARVVVRRLRTFTFL